jgi:hypothetical protein
VHRVETALLCCYEGSCASVTVAYVQIRIIDNAPIILVEWAVWKIVIVDDCKYYFSQ